MKVRLATSNDRSALADLIKEFCEEDGLEFNITFVEDFIDRHLEGTTVLVAVDDEDKLLGVISFVVKPHQFTGEPLGTKVTWFVTKEHRGRLGTKLLKKSEEVCMAFGIKEYLLALPAHVTPPKGYVVKEIIYTKEFE